jgi:hypothetical protein
MALLLVVCQRLAVKLRAAVRDRPSVNGLVSPPFLRGRFKYADGISSPATGDTLGTRASTASNLSRDARLARFNKYSWVINAATFSAAAELINWFNETPSFSARSDSLR